MTTRHIVKSHLRLHVVALALALTNGCAARRPAEPSLYQRLGGLPAITAMVEDTVGNIAVDGRINARFAGIHQADLTKGLVELVCERTGGPCTYRGRDMATAHEGMQISDDEFDALVEDLARSLDKFHVPAGEKDEVLRIVEQMRNAIVGH